MFVRDLPGLTLDDLPDLVHSKDQPWSGTTTQIKVDLDQEEGKQSIWLGDHQVPANKHGLAVLGTFFEVPTKFLERIQPDEQQFILDHRIDRTKEEYLQVRYNEHGLVEMFKGAQVRLSVSEIVEALFDVMPPEAEVVEWWANSEDMRFDIIVPEGFDKGIGGDPKIGDITRGGIRVGQDRGRNLAPWVQPYMFRLECTNGNEVWDPGLRVDARGREDLEVLAILKGECRRAFDRVEGDIEAFYDLRSHEASADVTGEFRRIALEQGLPDRTVGHLENTLPEMLSSLERPPTHFDFVNHITNAAVDESLYYKPNARRVLEQAGGRLISEHVRRCGTCHARLN